MYWQLFIHIGPVQDFIMSARRCRDLWFGSQLLSELAKAAATAIQEEIGATDEDPLIFPNAQSLETGSVANKIVVRVPDGDVVRCGKIADAGRAAMKDKLKKVSEEVFGAIENTARPGNFKIERARAQIDTCMEYMWVAVPEGKGNDSYVKARQRGEALLAARKNTRNWAQPSPAPFGIPKSSLDGARESVIHEHVYDKRKKDRYVPQSARHRVYGVKGEERLCGIGLVKRKGRIPGASNNAASDSEIPTFHSAAHIASAGVRRRLAQAFASAENESVKNAYNAWLEQLQKSLGDKRDLQIGVNSDALSWTHEGITTPFALPPHADGQARPYGYDGVALYPQRIPEILEIYQDEKHELDSEDAKVHRKDLENALRKLLGSINIKDPYPYYALLVADGDKMGAAIQQIESAQKHREFSRQLDKEFAQEAKGIIQRHGGTLIFAGGDDVLAMLPTCTALEASRALRDVFKEAMGRYTYTDEHGEKKAPTLSVGLALGHFMTPFAEVRALAKQAESIAKSSGRNRLAILWDKRSGATRSVVGEWKDRDKESELALMDRRLIAMASWLENAGLPRSFAHHLLEVLDVVGPSAASGASLTEGTLTETENEMLLSLARRVIGRRPIEDKYKNQFADFLTHAYNEAKSSGKNAAAAIQTLAHELLLANEFRRARKEAGLDMELWDTEHVSTEAAE